MRGHCETVSIKLLALAQSKGSCHFQEKKKEELFTVRKAVPQCGHDEGCRCILLKGKSECASTIVPKRTDGRLCQSVGTRSPEMTYLSLCSNGLPLRKIQATGVDLDVDSGRIDFLWCL